MKKFVPTLIIVLFLAVGSISLEAHCYEVGFRVMDSSQNVVSIPVRVYERDTAIRIDNGSLCSSSYDGYNFRIDLNTNCYDNYTVQLETGVVYVIQLYYPAGVKSFYYSRDYLQCTAYNSDTYYNVTPTSIHYAAENDCPSEDIWGYPDAQVQSTLSLSLTIYDIDIIGSKTIYSLRATATGGNQSYYFTWSNAYQTSDPNVNPNTARRTVIYPVTVGVTVTSGGDSVTKTIRLVPEFD